jgi:hypothetical protein
MAYDSQKQKAILFGGTIYDVKLFNDPWEQDPGSRTLPAGHKLSTQAHHQGAGIQWFMMKIEKR